MYLACCLQINVLLELLQLSLYLLTIDAFVIILGSNFANNFKIFIKICYCYYVAIII